MTMVMDNHDIYHNSEKMNAIALYKFLKENVFF